MPYNNVGAWYSSFLNRNPTADELDHWNTIANQDPNGALDQFLATAQQERPLSSLTDHQRKVYEDALTELKSNPDNSFIDSIIGNNPKSYDDFKDALYEHAVDVNNDRAAFDQKYRNIWDSGGKNALAAALANEGKSQALLEVQAANRKPNGSDNSFFSFLKEGLPIVAMPFVAGAGLQALGLGAAGSAGATAAGASGAGTGAAAAGAGGATSGLGGALSSTWASLPTAAQSALTNMGVRGAMNLATGQPLSRGLLAAGLTGGAGSLAAPFTSNIVGEGLSSLGFSPETVSSLIKPITTGVIGTGTGLARGQNFGDALLNGIQSGTISYAGDKLNGFIGDQGYSQPVSNILSSAGKGAISSMVKGKNPLAGLVSGATSGAFNYGAGLLGSGSSDNNSPSKVDMSGDNDNFSVDGNDWLSKIENDYSDPYGFRTDFANYGNDSYEPYTMNDSYSDTFPDLMNYTASEPDTGNSAMDNFLKQLGGGLGSAAGNAVGGGSSNPFLNNLMKQLGHAGNAASNNPLAAIAAAIGAYGSLKGSLKGPDLSAVDNLMAKGAQQMNTPAILPRGNIVGRDPRLFTQNYAADNSPVASAPAGTDYHSALNALYQGALGRTPDAAGEQYWSQQMQNGMSMQDVLRNLQTSQEAQHNPANLVMTGALSKVNG